MTNESVGKGFNVDTLQMARNKSLEVILETQKQIVPGMTESETKKVLPRH